jgi:hypothetical protein
MCSKLPDCPHFHVVFTVPSEFHEFFRHNYRAAGGVFFAAMAETLSTFQRNNWGVKGAFFAVLHTWGSSLFWHPHLHVLVSAGGESLSDGRWKAARANYLFPVRQLSRVFGAIMLRRLEALEGSRGICWPASLDTPEARRDWRLRLAGKGWNVFSRPTLGNTRAVVRYLARYTSRIALSNRRIKGIDEEARTVRLDWKDYRQGGQRKEMTLEGCEFIRRLSSHLVPTGFRRIRQYGLLSGRRGRALQVPGGPRRAISERCEGPERPSCGRCGGGHWAYTVFINTRRALEEGFRERQSVERQRVTSCSLRVAAGNRRSGRFASCGPRGPDRGDTRPHPAGDCPTSRMMQTP